jgi:putative FmdB family regulatory protein
LTAASANAAEGGTVPTYQYACTDCAERLEVVQKFSDDPLTVCSSCGGRLRKVFSPVGIVFKGSGFYRTDSRKGQGGAEPALASSNGKAADGASSSGSDSGSSSESKGDKGGDKKTPAGSGSSSSGSSSGSSSSSGPSSSSSSGSKVA